MTNERPPFLYKYRAIDETDIDNDKALDALFNSYAVFSSRKNFNDPFDSKIHLIRPSAKLLKSIRNTAKTNKTIYSLVDQLYEKGKITLKGERYFNKIETMLNAQVDSYTFFCVSAKSKCNLMWSHYANWHRGFCIEFKSEYLRAEKVKYQKNIPEIDLTYLILLGFQQDAVSPEIEERIKHALLITKLDEWGYEEEYRFHLNDSTEGVIPLRNGNKKVPYTPEFVESVIFGCRTPDKIKKLIAEKMPYPVKLKQAVEGRSTIEIIDSNLCCR